MSLLKISEFQILKTEMRRSCFEAFKRGIYTSICRNVRTLKVWEINYRKWNADAQKETKLMEMSGVSDKRERDLFRASLPAAAVVVNDGTHFATSS